MKKLKLIVVIALIGAMILSVARCDNKDTSVENQSTGASSNQNTTTQKELKKIRVGYLGNACEAPIYVA